MEKQIKIKTILVAVDFSEKTDSATLLAVHMARRHRARVILFHNLTNFYVIDRTGRQVIGEETISKHYKEAENSLNLMKQNLQVKYKDVNFINIIGNDSIINSINKIIDAESVDLVIAGTSGKQGLREFILGSSSYQILTGASCSVLLMPEDSHQYTFEKILVPVRVIEKLDEKLEISKLIAEKNKGFIGLLGISDNEHFRDVRKAFIRARQSLRTEEAMHHSSFVVSNHNKAVEISKASKDDKFDLIILNYQDEEGWKSFFSENFFKQIINNTSVPLLFFKDDETKPQNPEPKGYDITLPFPG